MNDETVGLPRLRALFDEQRAAFAREMMPAAAVRDDRLFRLGHMLRERERELIAAIEADFGHRPRQQTQMAEIVMIRGSVRYARRHLRRWMKPARVRTAIHFWPGRTRIIRQPRGVVGIVSPWNYPLSLSLGPAVDAIAAGNRVMIKPTELTPRFSSCLAEAIGAKFDSREIAVIEGGPDTAKAFVELPFDYLLFTGSTAIGREVAKAAAGNLVPVTLELGGKSPAIIDASADLSIAAPRIATAKLFNAGQTCIAPDYLLVERGREEDVANAILSAAAAQYPAGAASPAMTGIINGRHYERLQALLEDAAAKGARSLGSGTRNASSSQDRRMNLTVLLGVTDDMRVMQEEIFGPILPIVSVADAREAIAYVNAHPRPLALYWFGEDAAIRDMVLRETISGGVTINDCMWHFGQEAAPFGGVGASGYGAYHGEHGFRAFSHEKTVFHQSRWTLTRLFRPPYGARFDRMMRVMRRR